MKSDILKNKAIRLGFDLAGITTLEPSRTYPAYESWLQNGYHAGMDYLARPESRRRRADPRMIQPHARSALVLARHYSAGISKDDHSFPAGHPLGSIAAYAYGKDYHDEMKPGMHELLEFIEKDAFHPAQAKWYIDTAPILERELANKAGMGWIGKNTCLIVPRRGSYFFLAEILTDIEFDKDEAILEERCGSCQRCIQACPTAALLPGRVLDARRCLSYLTIEHKGAIPHQLRRYMYPWVFGCDICQQVCPWNERFDHRNTTSVKVDLFEEVLLSEESFKERYADTPITRAKRRGYVRNVCIALGNSANRQAIPLLIHMLESETDALLRGHAAWSLGRLGGAEAKRGLRKALQAEENPQVIGEIKMALEVDG